MKNINIAHRRRRASHIAIAVCLALTQAAQAAEQAAAISPIFKSSRPAGVLSNAATAAAAAADAANAAAAAAAAAAKAAAAAVDSIESLQPGIRRGGAKSIDSGSVGVASGKTKGRDQSADTARSAPAPTADNGQLDEPGGKGDTRFHSPEDQSLIALAGMIEVPVTVDPRGELAAGFDGLSDSLTEGIAESVGKGSETDLTESISAGRSFNRDTRAAAARSDQAKAQSGQALALLLPSLNLKRSGGQEKSDPTQAADKSDLTHRRTDSSLTLRQPLVDLPNFFDYRRRGIIERSREESRRAADGDAYLASVNSYLALVSTRLQANFARDFEAQLQDLLTYIEKRALAGASTASDMARVRARSQAALSSRLEQEAAHAAAGVEYLRLTNLTPKMARLPIAEDLGASQVPGTLDRAVSLAMEVNPEIGTLVAEAKAADIDKSAASMRFLPRLDLELSNQKTVGAQGDPNPAGQRDTRAMLVMNWSMFSGFGDVRLRDERDARHLELKYKLDDQRRRVVQTLSAQYATLTSTRERITAGYRELKAMSQAAEAMSARMLSGNQSLLDLLDVYDRYFQARSRLVTLHVQEMNSVAQIVRLVQGTPANDGPPLARGAMPAGGASQEWVPNGGGSIMSGVKPVRLYGERKEMPPAIDQTPPAFAPRVASEESPPQASPPAAMQEPAPRGESNLSLPPSIPESKAAVEVQTLPIKLNPAMEITPLAEPGRQPIPRNSSNTEKTDEALTLSAVLTLGQQSVTELPADKAED